MPDWELGVLRLREADAGEVVGAVALGAFTGLLDEIDLVANRAMELILGRRLAA